MRLIICFPLSQFPQKPKRNYRICSNNKPRELSKASQVLWMIICLQINNPAGEYPELIKEIDQFLDTHFHLQDFDK